MELKEFIDKVVICPTNNKRYLLYEIKGPTISALEEQPNTFGTRFYYSWETINGDPITNGYLVFEDQSLTEPFKQAYEAYSRTKDAYLETYEYYMRKE